MKFHDDAAGLKAFMTAQSSIIERAANEATFPEILYPSLIPVTVAGNPFATSVLYVSNTQQGRADWVHGDADDVPMADAGIDVTQTPVYTAGIGYGFGWEEINQAMQLGVPLDSYKAVAARRAYEQMVDRVAFDGDVKKGFTGLVKASFPSAGTLSDWTASPAVADKVIISEFNELLFKTGSKNGNVPTANTVLLPTSYYQELWNRYQPNGRDNLLTYLRDNNAYTAITGQPITIRALNALENVGSNKARIIAYRRSPDVLTMHIPMPHRFMPVFQAGPLRFEVPGVFRLGGLNIRRAEDTAQMTNT